MGRSTPISANYVKYLESLKLHIEEYWHTVFLGYFTSMLYRIYQNDEFINDYFLTNKGRSLVSKKLPVTLSLYFKRKTELSNESSAMRLPLGF